MNRTKAVINATLLSLALALSSCAGASDYSAPVYPYAYNGYANYYDDFGYGPPVVGWDRGYFRDGRGDGHLVRHFGHHFGRPGGHELAGRVGFAGHGGGEHR
jgi:hypothetical protein